jgi:hypothetical protein
MPNFSDLGCRYGLTHMLACSLIHYGGIGIVKGLVAICHFLHLFSFAPVLRMRIRMSLGLPDPHPDPLVISTDPAPDPCIIKQNSKKNLDFYCFVTS